jgi:O-succinylbenzoate synthase
MTLQAHWKKHTLQFRFEAGTSRGVLTTRDTWYISLWHKQDPSITGIGECGPLKGLSPDDRPDFEMKLQEVCKKINTISLSSYCVHQILESFSLQEYPSILFGIETALLDLENGGRKILFDSPFTSLGYRLPINGLVWMGDEAFMQHQVEEKIQQGYTCIKIKIGALDFDTEIKLIANIRKRFSENQVTIRVDANGSFGFEEAKEKLKILSEYSLHSIEQPIIAGLPEQMKALCADTPLPIALDEEIIGIKTIQEKKQLLEYIRPQYIILKPTLVGGMEMSREWIRVAEQLSIGWWNTSALESNIGLNAISQFTASLSVSMPQGLGTGQLYHNNIHSPLTIAKGKLFYDPSANWDLSFFS